jgi:hypothetical protein
MNACAANMNAAGAKQFPLRTTTFFIGLFLNRYRLPSVSSAAHASQEIIMTLFRKMPLAIAAPAITALLSVSPALASQGPGGGLGTASSFTQLTMAILVWGASALVVGAGLIGAVRRRPN